MKIKSNSGFTMIEILVTLIILLIGLLGLAGLQARVQQAEIESYQRTQALVLLEDMVDRINANRQTAGCYAITAASGTPYLGTGYASTPTCSGYGTTATQTLAVNDLTEWSNILKGNAETLSSTSVGAMVGARGCISLSGGIYTVTVAWQGLSSTTAPASTCAVNLYGTDTLRRAVTRTVVIGSLAS